MENGNIDKGPVRLGKGGVKVNAYFELSNDVLTVRLDDSIHPEAEFVFTNDSPAETPISSILGVPTIFAEAVFFDLNADGRDEIIVTLRSSAKTSHINPNAKHSEEANYVIHLMRWVNAWCIGYSPESGFWLADGEIKGDVGVSIVRDFDSGGYMLMQNDMNRHRLQGRELLKL